jgi:hypothetical protein
MTVQKDGKVGLKRRPASNGDPYKIAKALSKRNSAL